MSSPVTLTNESLSKIAPSIFAAHAHERVSEKYSFYSTSQVVDLLAKEGWNPVRASQARVRDLSRSGFQRHAIHFRHGSEKAMKIGDSIPELLLVNSHDTSSAFQIHAALMRLVCSNGLCVSDSVLSRASIRHVGFKAEDVIEASYRVLDGIPKIAATVEGMRSITLTSDESLHFAESALKLKYPESAPIEARQLLVPRRFEDRAPTLWNVFNRTQESLLTGGISGRSSTGRKMQTRALLSIPASVRLNKALWELAEQTKVAKLGDAAIVEAA